MSSQLEIDYPKRFVVKSNRMVKAKAALSKLEHRVLAALIAEIEKEDDSFDLITVRIRDLIERSGSKSEDLYNRGKEICDKLLDQSIRVQRESKNGERVYTGVNLLSKCEYVEGRGLIKARFTEDMRPFLLQLKNRFTMYLLQFFLKLDRKHSMRIYELLKMMEFVKVLSISVKEFREILGLENKYEQFSALRRYVIDRAQREIAEKTDIQFTYNVERDGQTPSRLTFYIHEKEEVDAPAISPKESEEAEEKERIPAGGYVDYDTGERKEVNLNVRDMFMADLTQEEISSTNNSVFEELERKAVEEARLQNPNRSWSVVASEAIRVMHRLWEEKEG